MLLAHPDIDVNQKSTGGQSPFIWACESERTACVRLLLKDPRVEINDPDNNGYTPLWYAAANGHLEVIKWWIASGREMDLGQPENWKNDAIGVARGKEEPRWFLCWRDSR
jgi:ankyrin repeat protein